MTRSAHSSIEHIAGLVEPEVFEEGQRLFAGGAVLESTHPSRRVVLGKVADERGRFAKVRLCVSRTGPVSSCSCGRSKGFCPHAIALLLDLCQRGEEDFGEVPFPPAAGRSPRPPTASASHGSQPGADLTEFAHLAAARPSGLRGVRDLLLPGTEEDLPVLRVLFPAAMPQLDDRWARLQLHADIICNGRTYSPHNIQRLVESRGAAGKMTWDAFSCQARQLMRFLATQCEPTGEDFVLGAYETAELLSLLRGYPAAFVGESPLAVHAEEAEPVLIFGEAADGSVRVRPGFRAAGFDLLPAQKLSGVIGRAVDWIMLREHAWACPPVLEPEWCRYFLKGAPETVTPQELAALSATFARRRIPVRLMASEEGAGAAVRRGTCLPVLYLDWRTKEVHARLEFEYAGVRVQTGDPHLLPGRHCLFRRDLEGEAAATERLVKAGFRPLPGTTGTELALNDPDRLWDFWREGLERLTGEWTVFSSQFFTHARASAGLVRLDLAPGHEDKSWFEIEYKLTTEQGTLLAWDEIAAAVGAGKETVLVHGKTLVHISEGVRNLVRRLAREGHSTAENRLRFQTFSAPGLAVVLGDRLAGSRTDWLNLAARLSQPPPPDPAMFSPDLGRILRGYQKEGVAWLRVLHECGFHGILADEMGLGKTVQALALLAWQKRVRPDSGPALVVCPSSLMDNWRNEARKFVPELRVLLVRGLHRTELLKQVSRHDLVITSYALLRRDARFYRAHPLSYTILDEAQHIKNPQTINALACKQLAAEHRLILTGTPLENALREIWSLFDFLLPGYLGSRQEFRRRYEQLGQDTAAAGASRDLAARIRPFVRRRKKADVCQELPPKMEQQLFCEMDHRQWRLYATFLAAGRELLREAQVAGWQKSRFQVLAMLTRLRQICCHPLLLPEALREPGGSPFPSAKTELLQEVVLEAIDSGRRMILFSQFTSFLKVLRAWLEAEGIRYEYLDGATPNADRQPRVDRFNGDAGIPIFLLSLRAGGTGLNLTGADTVIHYDQWWNPMVEDQATDRSHRIGQLRQVTSLKLMVRNTVEEKIAQLQQRKRQLFEVLMGGVPSRLGELVREDVEYLLAEG